MKTTIHRTATNRLYTEGELRVNDLCQTLTVECTDCMLPPGIYQLRLVKKNAHCRELVIKPEEPPDKKQLQTRKPVTWRLGMANSWIDSRKRHIVAIGRPLIPGVVFKAAHDYERLIKRLEKCVARKEKILLIIDESHCKPNQPAKHWLSNQQKKEKK